MHGGIWTLCIDLTDSEMRKLGPYGFPSTNQCISYLAETSENNHHDDYSAHVDYQMTRRSSLSK